tara:strand:- start:692 stop:988 length:297 start_codon:yes stop_codon:yes gene_type:complete
MSAQDNISSEWSNREMGALWKRTSKGSGQKYLAGHITIDELGTEKKVKIMAFSNKFKAENEKAPDLRIYLANTEEEETTAKTNKATVSTESSQEADLI